MHFDPDPSGAAQCASRLRRVPARRLPEPSDDEPLATQSAQSTSAASATAIVAGGCFWGVQAVFLHLKGVRSAISGYSGGSAAEANYDAVCSGRTDHTEAVAITYDPSIISYGSLLHIFFAIAHDPTELNRQGPDVGSQYRSAIFTTSASQERIANTYIDQLNLAAAFPRPIMTQVLALEKFYAAEDYHQNYALQHPENPYVAIHDLPKLAQLAQHYPQKLKA